MSNGDRWKYQRNTARPLFDKKRLPTYVDLFVRNSFHLISTFKKIIQENSEEYQKNGIDLLLESFARLKVPDWHLILAGSDYNYRSKLEQIILHLGLQNRVHFTGFVEGDQKLALLKSCNLLVLASRLEGLPVTVLEAMAVRKPVLISKACNLPEVAHANAGIEIEGGVESLTQGLLQFFAMDETAQKNMGECGHRLVKQHFSWESIVTNYIREMESLIARQV